MDALRRNRGRLAIAGAIMLLLALARGFPVWHDMANRAFDLFSTAGQPLPEEPGIVLVAIDEPSFAELGLQWPWPREIHAELIENLRAEGVRAIGFDVVFAEESDPQGDARLAAAAGPDIVFAADETLTENDFGTLLVRTEPFPALLEGGARSGVVSIPLDGDGVARHVPRYGDGFVRSLLAVAGEQAPEGLGGDRIQYFGPSGSYPRFSYYQALDPERFLPPGELHDAVVIVGYNLQASPDVGETGTDLFETPYTLQTRRLMPGPEIHATIYDNLRARLSIAEPPGWLGWATLLLGALAGLAVSLSASLVRRALLALGGVLLVLVTCWLALRFGRIWLSPAEPVLAGILTVAAIGARDFAAEQRRRREVQSAFSRYISPTMVERLVADPELLRLGGERKQITVLFADIRGFTTISEGMKDDPEALVRLINDILTPLTDIVIDHGGTIDKYMGDCIMAFWNAPLDDPDHALHAVEAARAMIAAMPGVNERIAASFARAGAEAPAVRIGIGINSGDCVVGNMGSAQRFDYSVLGDAVNTAARLEAKCKDYEVSVVIGETTAAAVAGRVALRRVDRATVRGKSLEVDVFTFAA